MTSPSLMHETGHSKSVHWDNPERWDREGDGSGVQDGGHLHTCGWFMSVQSFSCVSLFATPWTAARQASLSITNFRSPPRPMSIELWLHPTISFSVHPSSSRLQSFPASESFPMSQLFTSGGQSIGVSALTSVLPMNTQDWSLLWWTGWIFLQFKGLYRVFFNITVQKHQFFNAQLSFFLIYLF